eukprot:CAMPEP_0181459598 /NCGR_PEP_ID=MMETSP1110-20121109/32907_1 /TAXON_ID=174948 /ORGANISM="Symbiodinium sp., Strain CCMP421" /LENGTH=573 /DNA_ID=CAMNT_0023584121 /DNA_START=57 /DNA_END=1778 /DNA_ORIENTATION=-
MALKLLAVAFATCIGYAHSVRSTSSNSTYDLKAKAAMYVKSMEETALTKIDHYSEVPGMTSKEINAFLTHVYREVLEPELESHGYSRMVMATQATVVIGDLHGQLFNLLAFLRLLLLNSEALKEYEKLPESQLFICDSRFQYIFMGDYVDRGERSVEIVMLLLAYKALCPSGIILLQGNHEAQETNDHYGFKNEVLFKLDHGGPTWRAFNAVFAKLPFVAVAEDEFMATHGGITPDFVNACTNMTGDFKQCLTADMGSAMVWSDPHPYNGWRKSPRGEGIYKYGKDVTLEFLKSNNLKRLLRGHEQMVDGVHSLALGEDHFVQTIFTSADYVGTFCVNRNNRPLRVPRWHPQMFMAGGDRNLGGIVLIDLPSHKYAPATLSGASARSLAKNVTGAGCYHPTTTTTRPPTTPTTSGAATTATTTTTTTSTTEEELSWKEKFKRFFDISLLQETADDPEAAAPIKLPIECHGHLTESEAQEHEETVGEILREAESLAFEARKIVDLEGEAAVCATPKEADVENCKAMARDMITLKVFQELHGSQEDLVDVENRIVAREEEVEAVVEGRTPSFKGL